MLAGLMQQAPLLISSIIRHGVAAHPEREIVSRLCNEPMWRYDYAGLGDRAARAAHLLVKLGVAPGDRVTSLAWNTHRHLELFYAVPGIGAVLHTANPRFSEDQIVYTINHAESGVLFYDRSFAELVDRLAPRLPSVRAFVMLSDAERLIDGAVEARSYEALITAECGLFHWPSFDENSGAFLCYTSGTTGDPKGVLYSHRSVVLHAIAAGLASGIGLSATDCIMPCQSLYHATAWGLPFVGVINGCKFVLPCERFDGASLQQLILTEGVTFSGGVPTIWTMYLEHLHRTGEKTGKLRKLLIGGSAVPRAMSESFRSDYGVEVAQIWGMTETSPLGVIGTTTAKLEAEGETAVNETIWSRQGRMQFGIELKIVDEEGRPLPHDGESAGSLLVRGPWVIERYFRSETSAVDAEGWFDTGDVGTIDEYGFLRLTDRRKDVIKSGGEWISSIDMENVAAGCPGVRIAAVVGVRHPKWEERPILVVEVHDGATVEPATILSHLEPHMPRWWLPDAIYFDAVPLTATGKIDKKALRSTFQDCLMQGDGGAPTARGTMPISDSRGSPA